jgi:hypothetical protein
MDAASELAGRDVRRSPETWLSYGKLVHSVVDSIRPHPTIVLGVCTPEELRGWPIDAWILLDCGDDERARRLGGSRAQELAQALADAGEYRSFDLPVLDSTGLSPEDVAVAVAERIRERNAKE